MKLGKYTLVNQKKLDDLQIGINQANQRIGSITRQNEQLDKENQGLKESLDKLIGTPARIKMYHPDNQHPHFRLQMDFDPNYVMDALVHGNSDIMIEYAADHIKYQIIRELKTMNFVRYDEHQ
jgi:hypothetical protein